jgi:hypothetical protein
MSAFPPKADIASAFMSTRRSLVGLQHSGGIFLLIGLAGHCCVCTKPFEVALGLGVIRGVRAVSASCG